MTHEQIYALLQQLNIPLAYNHFKETQHTPYLIYLTEDTSNFGADNKVYFKVDNWVIELYTDKKELVLEARLEELLEEAELYYEKYEVYIDTENMYQVRYEI